LHAGNVLILKGIAFSLGHFPAHVMHGVMLEAKRECVDVGRFDAPAFAMLRLIGMRRLRLAL
jgi:hypothetical protein